METNSTNTEIALMKQELKYTNESVKRVEDNQKETMHILKSFIDSVNEKYARKADVSAIQDNQKKLVWALLSTF